MYRRRPSPLHAAHALAGAAWCAALALLVAFEHPLVLGVVLLVTVCAAAGAGVGRGLARAARWALPLGLLVAAVNPLVSRNGLTVLVRGGEWPVLGQLDLTLEATVYGGVLGLRAMIVVLVAALWSLAVDPDELLRCARRLGLRSALTAAVATRLFGVLARDGRRIAEAQRCRPGAPAPRLATVRAVTTGALERSLDVAATLELRGYGAPGVRAPRPARRAPSRHDLAFAASAAGLVALAIAGWLGAVAPFTPYPRLSAPVDGPLLAWLAAVAVVALLPFADRRGVG